MKFEDVEVICRPFDSKLVKDMSGNIGFTHTSPRDLSRIQQEPLSIRAVDLVGIRRA